jgi:hypothetical protein
MPTSQYFDSWHDRHTVPMLTDFAIRHCETTSGVGEQPQMTEAAATSGTSIGGHQGVIRIKVRRSDPYIYIQRIQPGHHSIPRTTLKLFTTSRTLPPTLLPTCPQLPQILSRSPTNTQGLTPVSRLSRKTRRPCWAISIRL